MLKRRNTQAAIKKFSTIYERKITLKAKFES